MKVSKKIMLYTSCAVLIMSAGCTKKFDAINTDPTQATAAQFDPNLLLSSTEVEYFNAIQGYNGGILFQSMWTQTFASAAYPSYYSNGDKYTKGGSFLDYQGRLWNHGYNAAGYAYEMQNLVKTNPALSNLSGIGLILELLAIQSVTDTYGDVPFSQALQAKTNVNLPVYDAQQAIYTSMLAKLDSVIPTLDAGKTLPTNDVFSYKGDISKWKKFGYSLMLRMAMRLTKADAATAQKYAEKAYAGGTFASNADDASVTFDHSDGYNNNNASAYQVPEDFSEVKWGKVLIDYLKSTNDPRLPIVAEVPGAGLDSAAMESAPGNRNPASQQGMPSGYDQNGLATDISHAPGYPGTSGTGDDLNKTGLYSRPSIGLYTNLNLPAFALNYAQTELLLAEAAARGWNVGASAAVHYANGVTGALKSYATLSPANGTIPDATIAAYVAAHPLDVSSQANSITQINMQYWVTAGTLLDFVECWSNWRRSGVPALTPVNYSGSFTNGVIPRRQAYPTTEASTNPLNYKASVTKLGGDDNYATHVWWDK